MMKINQTSEKYNGLNGFNIRCPFKSCNEIFYISECPKCLSLNKIPLNMILQAIDDLLNKVI